MVQEIYSGYKNLDNQARLGKSENMDSEAMLQAIQANLVSSIWRVSGKLSISQFRVVYYFHDIGKTI